MSTDKEKRNTLIMIGYFVLGYSSKELSELFGISRQAIEKITKKIKS